MPLARATRRSTPRLALGLALTALALCAGACSSTPAPEAIAPAPADTVPAAASVMASDDGLEVRWWITEVGSAALLDALGSNLTDPVPLDDRAREILAANGFRVVSVPIEMVDRLPMQLRPVGSVQQQRLAQTGVWTDVARGPTWSRSKLLTMHDGPLELPPGRIRLLARGWVTPTPSLVGERGGGGGEDAGGPIRPEVSFELVPQHQDRLGVNAREVADLSLEEPDPSPQGQGIMFWRLALRGRLRAGEALVILAEDPFHRWSEGEDEEAPPAPEEEETDASAPIGRVVRGREWTSSDTPPQPLSRSNEAASGPQIGPPSLEAPTVGEALLLSRPVAASGSRRVGRATRAVVVLVPRTPENFRLLGGR